MGTTTYSIEPHFIPGAQQGRVRLPNGWGVSAVTGPAGCGLHGDVAKGTLEVAIINPLGRMVDDPIPHCTKEQLRKILDKLATF